MVLMELKAAGDSGGSIETHGDICEGLSPSDVFSAPCSFVADRRRPPANYGICLGLEIFIPALMTPTPGSQNLQCADFFGYLD